jgi:hypothetical protein
MVQKGQGAIIITIFIWSGPSGVFGCTGQRRMAPAAGWWQGARYSYVAGSPRGGWLQLPAL